MVEYGLLVALIAIIGMVAMGTVGSSTEESFDVVAAGLEPGGEVADPGAADSNDPAAPGQDQGDDEADEGSDDQSGGAGGADDTDGAGGAVDLGGDDDAQDPGDQSDGDDQESGGQDAGEEPNGGDGGTGGPGGAGDVEEPEVPVTSGSTVTEMSTGAEYYWWNPTKNGGEGAWKASVSYENSWIRHQYLTLEIRRVDERGRDTVTTVEDFYVPASGRSTFELWDNALSVTKSNVKGIVSVSISVTAIRTSDESWETVSYTGDGTSSTVNAPKLP